MTKLLEVNTFMCPRRQQRITPELCARFRSEGDAVCSGCQDYLALCEEVFKRRKEWLEAEKRETQELLEGWGKRTKPKALKAPEERRYRLTLIEDMLGTVPLDKEVYQNVIVKKFITKDQLVPASEKEARIEEELEAVEDNRGVTGFFRFDGGIYLLDYQVKGFLKEAANILKDTLGITNLRSKVENYVFILPRRIKIGEAPSYILERPLRAMTMRGPRVTLARSEAVSAGVSFEIKILILPNKHVDFSVVEALLDYGKFRGLGQWRTAGFGCFVWERL